MILKLLLKILIFEETFFRYNGVIGEHNSETKFLILSFGKSFPHSKRAHGQVQKCLFIVFF